MKPILYFLFSFFIFLMSCQRSTEPLPANNRPPIKKVHLIAEDASCIEAWLKLTAENTEKDSLNYQLTLYRDEQAIDTMLFSGKDTLLYDSALQPSKSYMYFARIYADSQLTAISDTVTVSTMDTTSHDFEWQSWEFGGVHGSSSFNDVAIIDENDIWAVGEIHTAETDQYDSSGNWVQPYNAAHWDGEKWELKKIKTNACGGVDYPPIKTVFAFAKNDISFGHIDASITKFNGASFKNDCSFIKQINGSINKMWGTSDHDLYVVGNGGLIAHYNGQEWARIESGTDLPIKDIWGAYNPINKSFEIICIAADEYSTNDKEILKIKNKQVISLNEAGIPWPVRSIWFIPERTYYVCGSGIYKKNTLSSSWKEEKDDLSFFKKCIRGQSYNDIFICGAYGLISHFNGLNWYHYLNKELPEIYGAYYSLDYKENFVIAVGEKLDQSINTKSIILLGRRK